MSWQQSLEKQLRDLESAGLRRTIPAVIARDAREVVLDDGTRLVHFASNDYLGLSTHPRVIRAAREAAERFGVGSGASRLILGSSAPYRDLEENLAEMKGTEAALVFSSGYHANLGLIPVLAGEGDLLFADRLAHASLIDGCRASRATLRVFAHNDPEDLRRHLKRRPPTGQAVIVTEGVFSMDGDLAPLPSLLEVAEEFDALLVVDDAHGFGILGEGGRGTVQHFGLSADRIIQMGTLSKAVGCLGGHVAGPRVLIDLLANRARTFIYTTGLPPHEVAAAAEAVRLIREGDDLRERLWRNIRHLAEQTRVFAGLSLRCNSAIVPIPVGETQRVIQIAAGLREQRLFVPAIRPPTVPRGTDRLRVSLSALHTEEDILKLARTLGQVMGKG